MSSNKQAYRVGYGKPPTETRFQKGRSGNPSGRPKNRAPQQDTGKILQHIDNEEVILAVDGRRKRMLKAEILFQQLFAKAIKGDLGPARLIAKMAAKYFGPDAQGPSEVRFEVRPDEYFEQKRAAATKENP